jgi:hypothetical protein
MRGRVKEKTTAKSRAIACTQKASTVKTYWTVAAMVNV